MQTRKIRALAAAAGLAALLGGTAPAAAAAVGHSPLCQPAHNRGLGRISVMGICT
jgi:hypothetical protein